MRNQVSTYVSTVKAATAAVGQRLREARALGASAAECDALLRRILAANDVAREAADYMPDAAMRYLADAADEARAVATLARYLAGRRIGRLSRATIERALAETRIVFCPC